MNALKNRILEISYKNKSSHISSCLTAVDIIDDIYKIKKSNEPFILSSGHAFLGLAVVLEAKGIANAEELIEKHGVHPTRDIENDIWYTTGSLGCGITAACGFALADRTRNVYCLISDGECAESDVFSSLQFAKNNKLDNLHVYVNINGYSAYSKIDVDDLIARLKVFWDKINICLTDNDSIPFLGGLNGHYKVLSQEEYTTLINL